MKTYKQFLNENKKENPVRKYWDKEKTKIKSEEWFNSNGKNHRVDGPAYQSWYENGQKQYESWYLDGKWHRVDGPAVKWWYENGQKHYEFWYLDGNYHRVDGASIQSWDENGQKDSEQQLTHRRIL